MTLKEYYRQTFSGDLALLFRGMDQPHACVALGNTWMSGCTLLPRVPADHRAHFLACLYFTVLVDQAMHTHFHFESRRFEELTHYPKFHVGLGHPAHLNPILVFEVPIHLHLVAEDAIHQVIPEAMALFVDETASFFREHMPQIRAQDFFARLLADPDVNGGRQWAFATVADGKPAMKPTSLHGLLACELTSAIVKLHETS